MNEDEKRFLQFVGHQSVIDNPPRSLLDYNKNRDRIMDSVDNVCTPDGEQQFNQTYTKQKFTVKGQHKTEVFVKDGVARKSVRTLREVTTRKKARWWNFL